MSLLGNLVWIIFGGLFVSFGYVLGGLVLCLTIVGIPFGLQLFKIGVASLPPFGDANPRKPNRYRLPIHLHEYPMVIMRWRVGRSYPLGFRAAALHHNHRFAFWEAAFQTDGAGTYTIREGIAVTEGNWGQSL